MNALALLIERLPLVALFNTQAYDKIFTVGLESYTAVVGRVKVSQVSRSFVTFSTHLSCYILLIASVFLMLGLFLPKV